MADWPLRDAGGNHASIATSSSVGTSVTAGSANTKGASWTQLVASSSFKATGIIVAINYSAGAGFTNVLVDIGVGASSAEQVLIPNILFGIGSSDGNCVAYFPVTIPAGTRISARSQSGTASYVVTVCAVLLSGGFDGTEGYSRVEACGALTSSNTAGTSIDPGGTANTKASSWTQLIASTGFHYRALVLIVGDQKNNARTTCQWLMDVGVGASSAEQAVIPNLSYAGVASTSVAAGVFPRVLFVPVTIPAASRLSARAQCSITDATDRLFDLIAYGVG